MRARTSAAGTILLAWLIVLAAASLPLGAQAPPAPAPARPLLEVPYLTQTPELCGGAALAMVLRFWGDRDVFAEDFAHLIDKKTAGIPTNVLTTAAHNRGWSTLVTRASDTDPFTLLRTAVDRGHPVIALIEHAPRLYHYVVVVGLTDEAVVFHDPARAPYRVVSRDAFDRAWAVTDRWMLAVQRTAGPGEPIPSTSPVPVPASPAPEGGACGALVAQSVALAQAGEMEAAERGLLAATRLCPGDAAPWRELSGLRFVARQWDAAAQLATTAVRLAPDDDHAWQLLATSEYLQGHWREALRAWNHVDQPLTDTITVTGAVRTQWPVITARLGLTPRQLLTPDIFTRAARRLAALPIASDSQLRFEPTPDGRATIEAVIVERPVLPSGVVPLAFIGARAIVLDEVRLDVAGPTGSGELWSATWNWSETRPRLAFQLDIPSPTPRVPGIVSVGVLWERETYRTTRVDRRRVALRVADWAPRE
ncbi:MAG: C39 family peptidase, partial [Acidobacteria bacterium]|nr:C39 family peptidase [Acidobacteriota bacterium]